MTRLVIVAGLAALALAPAAWIWWTTPRGYPRKTSLTAKDAARFVAIEGAIGPGTITDAEIESGTVTE